MDSQMRRYYFLNLQIAKQYANLLELQKRMSEVKSVLDPLKTRWAAYEKARNKARLEQEDALTEILLSERVYLTNERYELLAIELRDMGFRGQFFADKTADNWNVLRDTLNQAKIQVNPSPRP